MGTLYFPLSLSVTLKLLKSNLLITKEKLNYLYEAGAFLIL